MSAQTVSTCVVCGSETDAFLCGDSRTLAGCLGKLMRALGDCAALVDELNTTLSRQDKRGGAAIGYVTCGGDERPLPMDVGAMESGLLLRDRLGLWARELHESHAPREEDGSFAPIDVQNAIVPISRWLMRHPTWIACHPAVDELYDEVMETIRLAWRSVDTAPGKVYIGQCGTVMDDWWGDEEERPEGPAPMCNEDLYAREGDWEKRCPVCAYIHDVRDRQDVMKGAAEHQYVPQRDLIGLVNDRGVRLTSPMFRSLRNRKRIVAFVNVQDGSEGASVVDPFGWRVRTKTDKDKDLIALYHVGKVLDVLTTSRYQREKAA